MKTYENYNKNSAPRIPNSEDYWVKKGKIGKEVMIYFHDDLDGIYSAILMKNYLEEKDFKIYGYGIVNYQEGWNTTKLNPKYINIAVDYAENNEGIDIYIDHHQGDIENNNQYAIKTETTSAYEGICDQLGLPIDSLVQNVIDMIDSAKYDNYNIKQDILLNFDPKKFNSKLEFAAAFNQLLKRSDYKTFIEVVANTTDKNPSIYNIYRLFRLLYPANNMNFWEIKDASKKAGFGDNTEAYIKNLKLTNPDMLKTFQKDFIEDAEWRLNLMQEKTRGVTKKGWDKIAPLPKNTIHSQIQFVEEFWKNGKIELQGYQIIGNMMFVPSETWANPIRARSILETDMKKAISKLDKEYRKNKDGLIPTIHYEIDVDSPLYDNMKAKIGQKVEIVGDISTEDLPTINIKKDVENETTEGIIGIIDLYEDVLFLRAKQPIFWILLQYGNTIQVASYHKLENYDKDYLPRLKDGTIVENLGKYCKVLLHNFETYFGLNPNLVSDSTTLAGGHKGIGTISNIFGTSSKIKVGTKFLDLIKNKMIQDLSGIPWNNIDMPWGDKENTNNPKEEKEINKRTMLASEIRKAQDIQNKK